MTKEKKTISAPLVFDGWCKAPDYQCECVAFEDKFAFAQQFIRVRGEAGLTQQAEDGPR